MPANNVDIRANWQPIPTGDERSSGSIDIGGSLILPPEITPSPTTPSPDEGDDNISPSPKDRNDLSTWPLWNIVLLGIIALTVIGVVGVLLQKRLKK
jgi:hypothetical protein